MGTQLTSTPSVIVDLTGLPEPAVKSIQQIVALLRGNVQNGNQPVPGSSRGQLCGCLAGMNLTIPTIGDLEVVRREMWANFPRDLSDSTNR